jgi:hypothetical protein
VKIAPRAALASSAQAFPRTLGGQGLASALRARRKNSPESGPFVSRANSSERPLGEKSGPISVPFALTSGPSFTRGRKPSGPFLTS